jgi:hypothetical protein
MKKFSAVIGVKVNDNPKTELSPKVEKDNSLKYKLIDLMNNILKVQSTGAARTELINSAITIGGKENLADAILDLIQGEFGNEKIGLLESLKSEMTDWYFLDKKIDQINSQIITDKNKKTLNIERKLIAFMDLYGDYNFELHSEMLIDRLNKKSELNERISVTESLIKSNRYSKIQNNQLKLLLEKFKQRVNKIYS